MKITKKSQTLVDQFDEAAQNWGWEKDQGVWLVDEAKYQHHTTRLELIKRIKYLESLEKQFVPRSNCDG